MNTEVKGNNKKLWLLGESKKDRKGRLIYFAGYSKEIDSKGNNIELWQPTPLHKTQKYNLIYLMISLLVLLIETCEPHLDHLQFYKIY